MNLTPAYGAGAPLKPSLAKTAHDHLPLPGGKTVGQEPDLGAVLRKHGVAGATADLGRSALAQVYAGHIEAIRKKAADAAVAEWLATGSSVSAIGVGRFT
jgi:hypothetical protein